MLLRRRMGLPFLCNSIHSCSALGLSPYTHLVSFTHWKVRTPDHHRHLTYSSPPDLLIYHYNAMIKNLSRQPDSAERAILIYNDIRAVAGLRPDTYSFPFVLRAVIRLSDARVGTQIHCQSVVLGLVFNVHVSTALIQMYAHCCNDVIHYARRVFDEMPQRDVSSWNAVIAAYSKIGDVRTAHNLFESMPSRNVISWTCLIAGYEQAGRPSEAISVFHRMRLEGVEPDEVVMLAVLSACAQLGALDLGKWVHDYVSKHKLHRTLPLSNALVDMYAKSGDVRKALEVFENIKEKSVITWTTMIGGLASHGLGREALEMFSQMERARFKPNDVTFIAILSACSHAGLVQEGQWFFTIMQLRYGIQPRIEHYGCMIDLLGRMGCLKEAEALVNEMPFEANGAIWGSLLAASRIHGDVALAERSLRQLVVLEPRNSGNYMILSNMYATHAQWSESGIMRKVMQDAGVRKVPAVSFIQVNHRLHEFFSGDESHPQFRKISDVLSHISELLILSSEMLEEQLVLLHSEDGCSAP